MPPLIPFERSTVFFDGIFSEPRLQHPEGVAVGPGGEVWCGSENGQILKIAVEVGMFAEHCDTPTSWLRAFVANPMTGR